MKTLKNKYNDIINYYCSHVYKIPTRQDVLNGLNEKIDQLKTLEEKDGLRNSEKQQLNEFLQDLEIVTNYDDFEMLRDFRCTDEFEPDYSKFVYTDNNVEEVNLYNPWD